MIAPRKYRLLVFGGILLPMVAIYVLTFLIGPRLLGEPRAAHLGSRLGFGFLVYLLIVVVAVVIRELRTRKQK